MSLTDTSPAGGLSDANRPGRLFLVPTPLGSTGEAVQVLPALTLEAFLELDYLIAENARSARAVLSRLPISRTIREIEIRELNLRTPAAGLAELLEPILAGRDAGLLSEAGCPAVADPGAALVGLAHQRGIQVIPLIGPSSILLALMASGMNGQRFAFVGYVPVPDSERADRLRALERRSAQEGETQILIETPYRNQALLNSILKTLSPDTRLAVASELSLPGESIVQDSIAGWRKRSLELKKVPTVFVLQATQAAPGRQGQDRGREKRHDRRKPT